MDNGQDSEDLGAAAARLGLTVETLRKRLQRGKIKGFKGANGAWRVVLDRVDIEQDTPGQPAEPEPGRDHRQSDAGQDDGALIAVLRDMIATLRDEVRFLRSQLQARDEEIRRVHVLLQQEQQQVKALSDQRENARRPWWRIWGE